MFRLKLKLRGISVMRLWNAWTNKYIVNSVVNRMRERAFREVLQVFKYTILRPRRTLFLTAAAYNRSSFDCDQGISDDELQALLLELENVETLTKSTLFCMGCGARIVLDRKKQGVQYCMCKEPQSSDVSDGWVPYMEAEDVIIWRKEYKPRTGLYAYKVYGRYPEVSASDFAAVQLDGAYRKAWDSAVAALAVVQRNAKGVPGQAVLHWEVLWPRLFANRDYVYIRRHKEYDIVTNKPIDTRIDETKNFDSVHAKAKRKSLQSYAASSNEKINNKVYIIVSKSCEHPDVPETRHAIRVSEYWSHMVVKTLDGSEKPGMEFVLTYYDEPAVGGMPGGVAAWASSRAAPVYLNKMRKAASEYRAWAASRTTQELPDFIPFGPDQVNSELAAERQEEDMETSKQGPEMENAITTRDQSSQTDAYLLQNFIDKKEVSHKEVIHKEGTHNEVQSKEVEDKEVQVNIKDKKNNEEGKKDKTENGKKDASTMIEEDKEKDKEEEGNGGWWRYLYPFYYFV